MNLKYLFNSLNPKRVNNSGLSSYSPTIVKLIFIITLSQVATSHPNQQTRRPIVTGTSVLGIVYKDGVMLAADTLCSYGSMAKYKDARRLVPVNFNTLLGGSGEYSDFQAIIDLLKKNALEDRCTSDTLYYDDGEEGAEKGECAREVWNYLRAVMYNR